MKFILSLVVFGTILKLSNAIDCNVENHHNTESRIKKTLFCNGYDSTVRPVKNHKTTTNITVKMIVKSYDYSDYGSTLTVNVWMRNTWKDEFLTWDPAEYDNIKSIDISSSDVWRSDFSLYNADISYGIGSCHDTNCLVESSGNITCIEPCSYTAHCKADYTMWPYDRQNCSMMFGPWMNNENEIDYVSKGTFVTSGGATQNTEWRLISSAALKKVVSVSSKDKTYTATFPNLYFTFTIERHSALPGRIVGASCMIMITINLLSMFIEAELVERVVLLCFNILVHFMIIHQLSWILPQNGDSVPNAMIFFRNSLVITLTLLLESIIVKFINSCERPAFAWMQSSVRIIREKQFDFVFFKQKADDNDENSLIEGRKIDANSSNQLWKNFCSFLDRSFFIIFTVTYAIMVVVLIPVQYGRKYGGIQVA